VSRSDCSPRQEFDLLANEIPEWREARKFNELDRLWSFSYSHAIAHANHLIDPPINRDDCIVTLHERARHTLGRGDHN
jgi:hypothetical protein